MKKLFAVLILLAALTLPAFAGRVTGGGAACDNVDCVTCVDASCGPHANAESGSMIPAGVMLLALALFIGFRLRS